VQEQTRTEDSRDRSASPHTRELSGWRLIGLYFYYVLLSALAAALAAIVGILPYWIWSV
jgi:hypothetical protein